MGFRDSDFRLAIGKDTNPRTSLVDQDFIQSAPDVLCCNYNFTRFVAAACGESNGACHKRLLHGLANVEGELMGTPLKNAPNGLS